MDLTNLTVAQLELTQKNISQVCGWISSFQQVLEGSARVPLQRFLDATKDDVLSWRQCMQIFEVRRELRDGLIELSHDLHPWTHNNLVPLLSRYISEVERYAVPVVDRNNGVLKKVELSTEPGWASNIETALVGVAGAASVTEQVLALFAQDAEEVQEELKRRRELEASETTEGK